MSEKKYVVPEGMLKAVEHEAVNTKWQSSQGGTWIPDGSGFARELLEVALRWWAENPIVPTLDQAEGMGVLPNMYAYVIEWQRRCFLADQSEYCQIELTQGQVALVDKEDYERLNAVKWYARRSGTTFYAERHVQLENGLRGVSSMHREAIGAVPGEFIDHDDRNGLHNWKANLRRCTEDQNRQNVAPHSDKQTSKYKGVCRNGSKGKYVARIGYGGEIHHIGYFVIEEDAARAYDHEARIHHGEFAYLNFPDDIRMFLAPEPEIPEAVKDLVVDLGISPELSISRKQFNRDILEAYRRGTLSQNEIK